MTVCEGNYCTYYFVDKCLKKVSKTLENVALNYISLLGIQDVSAKTLEPNISVICQRIFMKFKMQIF
jgi:hypothetical protein